MNNAVTAADLTEYTTEELTMFASAVKTAAAAPATVTYYGELAYIASVKAEYFPRSDRATFNAKLVACLQAGLIRMSRADLVGAMDTALMNASEIVYNSGWGKAEFHFIVVK
jgi:hypothetical protein